MKRWHVSTQHQLEVLAEKEVIEAKKKFKCDQCQSGFG
jgi:hypothetical protein